jgi:glycosyltransferase involved in cell wall biosynthesis
MNALHNTQALIRVFVPTYRRRALLPRALASLRAQTCKNWICEVHNDDPADSFPAELVKHLADTRIELHQHERNLGAIATFNLFYRPTQEPFYCVLEDDNWWEPEFLDTMIRELRLHPNITLAWCNQRVWEEMADGSWRATGHLVNSESNAESRLVEFGEAKQIMGAMHANGAMVLRTQALESYPTPNTLPFSGMEAFRERAFPHPLL